MERMSVLSNGTRRARIWIERFGGLSRWWDSCPRKIGTERSQTLNKGPVPFGTEPYISDSAIVALHAHGGDVPAQGFQNGFQCNLCWTSPLKSDPSGILYPDIQASCASLGKTLV